MDQGEIERLSNLSEKQFFVDDLKCDFGLSPVEADTLYHRITAFNHDYHSADRAKNQIIITVVTRGEPAGKPVKDCRKTETRLTMMADEDLEIRHLHGTKAERRARELRMCEEALEQNGVLTQEQLAHILCVSRSTVKRDKKALARQGITLPTRGEVEDIGPGRSHKARAVELVLKGHTFTEASRKIDHCPESVDRYFEAFSAVTFLREEGYPVPLIRKVTKISERVIKEYIDIMDEAKASGLEDGIERAIARFRDLYEIKKKMVPSWCCTGKTGAGGSE